MRKLIKKDSAMPKTAMEYSVGGAVVIRASYVCGACAGESQDMVNHNAYWDDQTPRVDTATRSSR